MFGWIRRTAARVWAGIKRVAARAKAAVRSAAGPIASAGVGAAVGNIAVKAAGWHALGLLGGVGHAGLNTAQLVMAGTIAGGVAGLALFALVVTVLVAYDNAMGYPA